MSQRRYIALQRDAAELQMLLYFESRASELVERLNARGADAGRLMRLTGDTWSEAVRLLVKIGPDLPHFQAVVDEIEQRKLKAAKHADRKSATKRRHAVK